MKPTSDPHQTKRGSVEGMKHTSNPIPSNDIAYRLRAKNNSRQATRQPTYLPETIFVYARNYSTQNRVQIPPTPTQPSQTPMFSRFVVLYQIFNRPDGANRDVPVRRTDTSVYARTLERLQGICWRDLKNRASRRRGLMGRVGQVGRVTYFSFSP